MELRLLPTASLIANKLMPYQALAILNGVRLNVNEASFSFGNYYLQGQSRIIAGGI